MKIGIDIVEIERFREKLEANPKLRDRLFTRGEVEYCGKFSDPVPHLAGTFAAKEAVIKTLGRNPGWRKIEVRRRENGAPEVYLEETHLKGSLSISHTHHTAVAVFLLLEVL